jgi:ABC-type branched-subunit amino acid transport system substrate-binding protein
MFPIGDVYFEKGGNMHQELKRHRGRPYMLTFGIVASAFALTLTLGMSPASSASSRTKTYDIGLISSTTGPIAAPGLYFADGVKLAVQVLNSEHYLGAGAKLGLITKDSPSDPATDIEDMHAFVADSSVRGVICCILTPEAGAVSPVAEAAHLPLVIYGATDSGLNHPPYVAVTATAPQAANTAFSKELITDLKPASVEFITTSDNSGIQLQTQAYMEPFVNSSVKDLGTINTLTAQTDFSDTIASAMATDPAMIIVSCLTPGEVPIIEGLREHGYTGIIVGNTTIASKATFEASGGSSLVDVPFPDYFSSVETAPVAVKFIKAYEAAFHTAPDSYAAQAYNGTIYLAAAIKDAGANPSRKAVANALGKIKVMTGTVYGTVRFSKDQIQTQYLKPVIAEFNSSGAFTLWSPSSS